MSLTSFTRRLLGRSDQPPPAEPFFAGADILPVAMPPATLRLPRFKGTARDSERSLRDDAGRVDQARMKLQRAFTPSQPVSDLRMFAGRKDVLLSLIRGIEEQQLHAVIFGDRGIGKTSLLHVFTQLAREARYIVRYTSCSETSEFDPTFRAIAADIPLLYHADFDPTSDAAERGATLDELLPETPLSVTRISELFAKLSGTRVIIILDEFDRANSADFKRSIAELIKSLSDRSIRVQIVIAGVAANLTELVEHIPSIRRNVLGIPVTMMSEDEIFELVELGQAVSGLTFDREAIGRIADGAQGSPYVAGLLAHNAAAHALDRRARAVAGLDVVEAMRRALRDVKVRIAPRALQQLAALESRATRADLAFLASEAMRNFGLVPGDRTGGSDRTGEVVELARNAGVVASVPVGDLNQDQFVDESIPLYLWLSSRIALTEDAGVR